MQRIANERTSDTALWRGTRLSSAVTVERRRDSGEPDFDCGARLRLRCWRTRRISDAPMNSAGAVADKHALTLKLGLAFRVFTSFTLTCE